MKYSFETVSVPQHLFVSKVGYRLISDGKRCQLHFLMIFFLPAEYKEKTEGRFKKEKKRGFPKTERETKQKRERGVKKA